MGAIAARGFADRTSHTRRHHGYSCTSTKSAKPIPLFRPALPKSPLRRLCRRLRHKRCIVRLTTLAQNRPLSSAQSDGLRQVFWPCDAIATPADVRACPCPCLEPPLRRPASALIASRSGKSTGQFHLYNGFLLHCARERRSGACRRWESSNRQATTHRAPGVLVFARFIASLRARVGVSGRRKMRAISTSYTPPLRGGKQSAHGVRST
jgi:hypothetical protein